MQVFTPSYKIILRDAISIIIDLGKSMSRGCLPFIKKAIFAKNEKL
jgi:hypothetical protein